MKIKLSENKGKIAIFIVALFGALILWIYAIGYDTQESSRSFGGIPVEITGVNSSGYTVAGIGDFSVSVDVDVVGTRAALNNVSSSDFRAYVDISAVNKPGYATLPVIVVVPNGLNAEDQSVKNVSLYIDKFTSKSVNIQIEKTFLSEYSIGEINTDLYAVSLYGPESELENVEAYCTFDLGNITQSVIHVSGNIMLRDSVTKTKISSPYITMNSNTVEVTFVMYREKNIPVELNLTGGTFVPEDVQFNLSEPYVSLYGPVDGLSALDSLKLVCDENKIVSLKDQSVPVSELLAANGLSEHVSTKKADLVLTYSVVLPKVIYRTINLPVSSITFSGVPSGRTLSVIGSEPIEVVIFGDPDTVKKYQSKTLSATIDYASIIQNASGNYYGILVFQTGDSRVGISGEEYSVLLDLKG